MTNPQTRLHGFTKKTTILNKAFFLWHKEEFNKMDEQLTFCKKVILFFDRIEERRILERHEFLLQNKITERTYQLANNLETR